MECADHGCTGAIHHHPSTITDNVVRLAIFTPVPDEIGSRLAISDKSAARTVLAARLAHERLSESDYGTVTFH